MAGRKRRAAAAIDAAQVPVDVESGDDSAEDVALPIAGIGASAGGLEAFQQLFRALPPDTGAGFVLIQHLAAEHTSLLAEILSRATTMPVVEVQEESIVEANHVYVIPPGRDMTIAGGALQLLARKNDRMVHRPVDHFFRSLAADRRQKAIGVILSGTGNDGTLGLEEIKAEGGITFAQDDTAQHDGMPRAAIASGCVDLVLPPDAIAREIARVVHHRYVVPAAESSPAVDSESGPALTAILQSLRNGTGVDFANYKTSTIHRRITRRMILQKVDGLRDYSRLLARNPAEVDALYQDILIGVTSFFRNPELFESLRTKVFPRMVRERSHHDPIRVWVPGCSTGEEAYSIAMTYAEFAEEAGGPSQKHVPIQIFATDLNARGVERARTGVYAKGIEQDVSPARLRRFFSAVDDHYRIVKPIRDVTVFARHNLLTDPPFSHMDLISCRNLLIYFDPVLQKRVVPLLHYALNPGGTLVLGSSETIGSFRDLFDPDEAKQRIFQRKTGSPTRPAVVFAGQRPSFRESGSAAPAREAVGEAGLEKQAERLLLARYAPPAVLIDADMNIVQVSGDTGPWLAPAQGKASLNLLKMAREGLPAPLRATIQQAKSQERPARTEGLKVKSNGGFRHLSLEVLPLRGIAKGGGYLVLFEEPAEAKPAPQTAKTAARKGAAAVAKHGSAEESEENTRLRQELASARESLQSVIEEEEAANEELQSANEEAQSSNEELQSVNEELQTSKEEIQSSNEELATVNDELLHRNLELNQLTNDLSNLIGSVRAPIVMLGPDLRIRRFTPMAEKTLNLIPADVGRPIGDLKLGLTTTELESMLTEVINDVTQKEIEVQDVRGCWHLLRMLPYKTLDNRIDGAVLMLVDVDALKRAQRYAESIVATVREPLIILDSDLRVQKASGAFYTTFDVTAKETEGRRIYDLGNRQWDVPALRQLLEEILPREKSFDDFAVETDFERIGRKIMLLNGRRLARAEGEEPLILLAIEDVTGARQLQRIIDVTLGNAPIDDLLAEVARRICESLSANTCRVLLLVDDQTALRVRASHGLDREAIAQVAIPVGEGISGTVAASRAPRVVESMMAVPIISGGELHGVLDAESAPGRHFTEREVDLMRLAAERIAQALDREARMVAEKKTREALESDSRAKDDFFASLSHELRTPMTAILGWTQLIEHAGFDPEMVPKAIEQISRGARTQARLIDDMFDVSRILVGELKVRLAPINLQSVVEESVRAAELAASQRGIHIETSLAPATVSGDSIRLGQVFSNLLSNSIKFSPTDTRIQVVVERDGDHVSVLVIDEGKGISAEFLPQLFGRFSQQEQGEYGGLGLGLSIAQNLVERHGGTIDATSEGEGKGATFRVTLPLAG